MSFLSYVIPGVVFFCFGLKWTLDLSQYERNTRQSAQKSTNHTPWRSSCANRTSKRNKKQFWTLSTQRLPFEGFLRLTVAFLGSAFSVCVAYSTSGNSHFVNHILNAIVYFFFALSGIVNILSYYCPFTLPKGVGKFLLSFAFTMEGLMFYLHLSHQSFMEQHVHILLVTAIFACAIATICETILPKDLPKFARALFTMIQGSWSVQVGFILHNPLESTPSSWTSSIDYNIALIQISLTFACHCVGEIILLLIIFFVSRGKRRQCRSNHRESSSEIQSQSPESCNSISNQCALCSNAI